MTITVSIFFKLSLSISIPISIFSKFPYRYRYFQKMLIDILSISIFSKKSIDISSIFQKMPLYRQSISIFHQQSMKKVLNLLKKMMFFTQNVLIDIDIDIDIFDNVLIDIDINIDSFKIVLNDIDIFQECRYIDNQYFISIYRTGLPPEIELLTVYVRQSSNSCEWKQSYIWLVVRTHSR